jgi:hypothetical protein
LNDSLYLIPVIPVSSYISPWQKKRKRGQRKGNASHVLYNDVLVSNRLHIFVWSHKIILASDNLAIAVYVYTLDDVITVVKLSNDAVLEHMFISKGHISRCIYIYIYIYVYVYIYIYTYIYIYIYIFKKMWYLYTMEFYSATRRMKFCHLQVNG